MCMPYNRCHITTTPMMSNDRGSKCICISSHGNFFFFFFIFYFLFYLLMFLWRQHATSNSWHPSTMPISNCDDVLWFFLVSFQCFLFIYLLASSHYVYRFFHNYKDMPHPRDSGWKMPAHKVRGGRASEDLNANFGPWENSKVDAINWQHWCSLEI